jgi:hypothetical protein
MNNKKCTDGKMQIGSVIHWMKVICGGSEDLVRDRGTDGQWANGQERRRNKHSWVFAGVSPIAVFIIFCRFLFCSNFRGIRAVCM